jgi:hypothetical protein
MAALVSLVSVMVLILWSVRDGEREARWWER